MAVYVDNMNAPYGRMVMCHMVADTEDELHAMAEKIGVARKWHQKPGTPKSHYDICLSKKACAISHGAVEIKTSDTARLVQRKRQALEAA